jgi:hypothetical protein
MQLSLTDSGTPAAERQIVALPPILGGCAMTCNDVEYFLELEVGNALTATDGICRKPIGGDGQF